MGSSSSLLLSQSLASSHLSPSSGREHDVLHLHHHSRQQRVRRLSPPARRDQRRHRHSRVRRQGIRPRARRLALRLHHRPAGPPARRLAEWLRALLSVLGESLRDIWFRRHHTPALHRHAERAGRSQEEPRECVLRAPAFEDDAAREGEAGRGAKVRAVARRRGAAGSRNLRAARARWGVPVKPESLAEKL